MKTSSKRGGLKVRTNLKAGDVYMHNPRGGN